MPKNEEYLHHQPRKIEKKKRQPGRFNEEAEGGRQTRINFKSYIRQIKEEELLADDDFDDVDLD
jgi:hypothetical protein